MKGASALKQQLGREREPAVTLDIRDLEAKELIAVAEGAGGRKPKLK